jgi:N-acetylmuramoyl-L-alanine amidase
MRARTFTLQPDRERTYRLVLDLSSAGDERETAPLNERAAAPLARQAIVAIDAGHGGKDPGAIGRSGTREKKVVLAIAKRLASLIDRELAMEAVLIRNGDQYLSLRERIAKARKNRADLFVSLHADAFRHARARGASVYVLSERGASSEAARWLASRENAADLVGGVSLGDKDEQLARVLLDLSQTATLQASHDLGQDILQSLQQTTRLHSSRLEQAGFVVLKAPDIPSVLVETGFISNPEEERKLRNQAHQTTIAKALLAGVRSYFLRNPPPGSMWAERQHMIKPGDTLSGIAQHYAVSTNQLRALNELATDLLRAGQVLRIPPPLEQTARAAAAESGRYER